VNTVSVLLRVRPGKHEEFLQTIQSIQNDLRKEAELLKSSLYKDMDDSDVFHLSEEWATQDSMEEYIRSERFSVFMGLVKVLCAESEIKYQLSASKLGAKIVEM